MHLHIDNGVPSQGLSFIVTICLLSVGVILGEVHIPPGVKDVLQCIAWIVAILVGLGSMFGINYKKLAISLWNRIKF